MANFTIGKYIGKDTIIHKLDPRIKIMSLMLLLVGVFLPAGYLGYLILGIVILFVTVLAKLKLSFVLRSLKPMLFMMIFLLIINCLTIKSGYILFTINGYSLYSDAIIQTLYIVIRLVLMIMLTTTLTATTKPLDLTLGIEDLLKPLKVIKVPAHEIAMMISIALRFIPTLIEEAQRIMKAQASRGLDLQEGNIKEKAMAILALIVPLFVSAFQRAEDLANAMEARGYVPSEPRTRLRRLKVNKVDYIVLFITIIILVILGILSWI